MFAGLGIKDLENRHLLAVLESRVDLLQGVNSDVLSWNQYRQEHPLPPAQGSTIALGALGFAALAAIVAVAAVSMGGVPLAMAGGLLGAAALGGACAGAWTVLVERSPIVRESKQIDQYERYIAQKEREASMSAARRPSSPALIV